MCVCVCVCVRARAQRVRTYVYTRTDTAFSKTRTMQGTQLIFLASFLTNTSYRPLIHLRQSDRSLNEIQQTSFSLLPCDKHISNMRLFLSKYDYIKRHIKKFLQLQELHTYRCTNTEWMEKKKKKEWIQLTSLWYLQALLPHSTLRPKNKYIRYCPWNYF